MDKRKLIEKIRKATGQKAALAALATLLDLSIVSTSKKLNGIVPFKPDEIDRIREWLGLTDSETVDLFIRRRKTSDGQYQDIQ